MTAKEHTIVVQIEDDRGEKVIRHFNVDNIAYISIAEGDLTTLAMALIFGISLIAFVMLIMTTAWWIALIVSVVILFILAVILIELDGVALGTLTHKHSFSSGEMKSIEEEFLMLSHSTLTFEGKKKDAYNVFTYRYHFVPDNIVSIQHEEGRSVPVPLILVGLGVVSLIAMLNNLVSPLTGFTIMTAFFVGAYYAEPFKRMDKIVIDLQSNEEEAFVMTTADAKNLLLDFSQRNEETRLRET